MSQENVEVARQMNEAFNAHDIDRLVSHLAEDCEFVDHMGAAAEEAGSDIETIRRLLEGWFEAFPDFRANIKEFIDAGDRVVCVTDWQGTGAGSGFPYFQAGAEVLSFSDGKITSAELGFANKAAALEAAGLSE